MASSGGLAGRFAWALAPALLTLAVSGVFPGPARAGAVPSAVQDSLGAGADSAKEGSSASEPALRVYLDKGRVVRARRVQLLANGLLRITRSDGSHEHVAATHVLRILDDGGADVTSSVLDERRARAAGESRGHEVEAREWDAARVQLRAELGYGTSKLSLREVVTDSGAVHVANGEWSRKELHFSLGGGYRLTRWGPGGVQPDLIAFASLDPSFEVESYGRRNEDLFGLVVQGGLETGVRFRAGEVHHLRFFASLAPGVAVFRSSTYRAIHLGGNLCWTGRLGAEWQPSRDPISIGLGARRFWRGTVTTDRVYPTFQYRVEDRYTATDTQIYLLIRSKLLW